MIIAAQASAPGRAAISVIRLSGDNTITVLSDFFQPHKKRKSKIETNHLYYGKLVDLATQTVLDEVTVVFFKKGQSYTGEESAEIFCHGSPLVVRNILNSLYNSGKIRQAEPGEFTKLRFMNGKIDLVQAEAVIDLINSETEMASRSSQEQLSGILTAEFNKIKNLLKDLTARLELELDFNEEELDFLSKDAILIHFDQAQEYIEKFSASFQTGQKYRDGLKVALTGKVNAGKSFLMNRLLKNERVIVTEIAGTTRDVIEEKIEINGFLIRIFDTAGVRETEDLVEKEGIRRSLQMLEEADLILHVIDSSIHHEKDDYLTEFAAKTIRVYNKADLASKVQMSDDSIQISCLLDQGIDELKHLIVQKALHDDLAYHPAYITNLRHFQALENCRQSLLHAREALIMGLNNTVIISEIRQALTAIGIVTGETTSLDIINHIFGSFCIGK